MAPPESSLNHRRTTSPTPTDAAIPPLKSFSAKSSSSTSTAKKVVASAPYAEQWEKPSFTLKDVRDAIPARLFKRDTLKSFSYVVHDFVLMGALLYAATRIADWVPSWAQPLAWAAYWWCQGIVCTGIWVIAHGELKVCVGRAVLLA